jgi:flagellar biosynthesis/type III secretory pathway M-ring protein FliF/YscJ
MPAAALPFEAAQPAEGDIDVGMEDVVPKKKSKLMLWLIIGGAVFLTLIVIVLVVYFMVIRPAQNAAAQFDQLMGPDLQMQLQQIPTQPGAVPQLQVPGVPQLPANVPTVPIVPTVPTVPPAQPAPAGQ